MTRPLPRHRAAGFTLIEALVALAILGAVLGTVYAIVGEGLRQAKRDEDRLLLALIAQNLLVRSRLDLRAENETLAGDIEGGLRWTIASSPYELPELPDELEDEEDEEDGSLFGEEERDDAGESDGLGSGDRFGAREGLGARDEAAEPADEAAGGTGDDGGPSATDGDREPARQQDRLELRLVRVTVEKGGERFELTGLAPVRQEEAERGLRR